jgi:hypothetical protein
MKSMGLKRTNSHYRNFHKKKGLKRSQYRGNKMMKDSILEGSNIGSEEVDRITFVDNSRLRIVPSLVYFSRNIDLLPYYIFDKEALERLRRHVGRVLSGNSSDYKSPFVFLINKVLGTADQDMNSREPIKDFLREFVRSDQTIVNSQSLLKREDLEIEKISTTSISLPWKYVTSDGRGKRVNAIAYYSYKETFFKSEDLELAISRVIKRVSSDVALNRTTLEDELRNSNKTTNWGLPLWLRGNEIFNGEQVADFHYKIAKRLESKELPFFKALCVLVERVQPNGTFEPKQRAAMAFPHYITLLESTFLTPLLSHFRSNKIEGFEEYFGRAEANEKITNMLERANMVLLMLGFDGESFDTNLIRAVLDGAYDVVKSLFPYEWHWLIEELKIQNIEADWVTPDGIFTGRVEGMSSGCGLTNIIDTLVQFIFIEYCAVRLNLNDEERDMIRKIMNGDDGNWQVPNLDKELMVEFCSELGMPINFSKALEETEFTEFCQRYYEFSNEFKDSQGVCKDVRSISRTANSILSFERKPSSEFQSGYYSVRVIGQLEEAANNPLFTTFIDLLIKSDNDNGLGTNYTGGTSEFIRSLSRDGYGTFETIAQMERANSYEKEKAKGLDQKLISLRVVDYLDNTGR